MPSAAFQKPVGSSSTWIESSIISAAKTADDPSPSALDIDFGGRTAARYPPHGTVEATEVINATRVLPRLDDGSPVGASLLTVQSWQDVGPVRLGSIL
jgi:hypothetical protein